MEGSMASLFMKKIVKQRNCCFITEVIWTKDGGGSHEPINTAWPIFAKNGNIRRERKTAATTRLRISSQKTQSGQSGTEGRITIGGSQPKYQTINLSFHTG